MKSPEAIGVARNPEEKIVPFHAVGEFVDRIRQNGKQIVLTSGVFDLLHPGHLKALNYCKSLGDTLIVGINSDESAVKLKDKTPVKNQDERVFLMAGFECVDYVVIFDEIFDLVKSVRPEIRVLSTTGLPTIDGRQAEISFIQSYGGKVIIVDAFYNKHTQDLITQIKNYH